MLTQETSLCINTRQILLKDTPTEHVADDVKGSCRGERHKRLQEQKEVCTHQAAYYRRQLASLIVRQFFLFEFIFATTDILINCRRADNNNLSLTRFPLFEMSLDKRLLPYQDLSLKAENNPLCSDERAAKCGD